MFLAFRGSSAVARQAVSLLDYISYIREDLHLHVSTAFHPIIAVITSLRADKADWKLNINDLCDFGDNVMKHILITKENSHNIVSIVFR